MVVCLLLLNAVGILAVEQKNKQNKSKLQVIKTSSTETRSYKDTKKEKTTKPVFVVWKDPVDSEAWTFHPPLQNK